MKVRQISTVAGLATGAAIAFAPLASAAPGDLIDFDALNASQIASLNSLFTLGATFTGVPDTAYSAASPGGFLAIDPEDLATYAPPDPATAGDVTAFEYFLYGVNPIDAGISTGSGAYNVFNGALIQFADASNASLFQLFNPNEVLPSDIFIGSATNVANALASDDAAVYFYNFAIGDLGGYFQQDLSFLQIPVAEVAPAAAGDIDFSDLLSSQVASLNGVFNLAAALAGESADVVQGSGDLPFDTIATADSSEIFNTLIFGLNPASVTDDAVIGSYHVLNGALTQFSDAYNVGLYALLSGGELVPEANYGDFLFGAEASILDAIGGEDATVLSAITDFMTNGFNDLLGYFDPTALLGGM
jgi:hypothetical protein